MSVLSSLSRSRGGVLAMLVAGLAAVAVLTGAGSAHAMAGGTVVTSRAVAPWMASLAVRGDGPLLSRTSCGGALIAPATVITAAHCTAGLSADQVRDLAEVHVGATTLSRDPGVTRRIVGVRVHPGFRLLSSPAAPDDPEADSATFDVELLQLDRPVPGVRPLRWASSRPVTAGLATTLFGHGVTDPDSGTSDALRAGSFRVGRVLSCATATPAAVDPTAMLCLTSPRAEACTGDSGGPFVTTDARDPALVAVFSFAMETAGRPCGAPGPAFATSVAAIRPWLDQQLADRGMASSSG